MIAEEASRTALRVALRRAAHQLYDARPLVFEDPVAVAVLGDEFADELRRTETKLQKPFSLGLRAFLVARSRYAEDCLAQAYSLGVRQYCLLGAGLDTFGLRNQLTGLRVFEVDHPATQGWKRGLLMRNRISMPSTLRLVPVDFEHQDLAAELKRAGFDERAPAVFAWLGVVPYLSPQAFRGTLAFIANGAEGSGVVMDYGRPRESLPLLERMAHDSMAARVALSGEPFRLFFTAEEMAHELGRFPEVEDLGRDEINARYFDGRSDQLRIRGSAGRLVSAWL